MRVQTHPQSPKHVSAMISHYSGAVRNSVNQMRFCPTSKVHSDYFRVPKGDSARISAFRNEQAIKRIYPPPVAEWDKPAGEYLIAPKRNHQRVVCSTGLNRGKRL